MARYWRPVFYFLRARGHSLHAAEDLTQDFFLRLLERKWLVKADSERGRFRTFLLTLLTRFVSDQGPRRAPRQIAFEREQASIHQLLGDADRAYEPAAGETPDGIFMKKWAAALLENVHERLRQFYEDEGRPHWYQLFATSHLAERQEHHPRQEELALQFQLTRDQVRYALDIVEQRYVHFLREEVRDQVGSDAGVGDEIRDLLALLATP